MGGTCNTCRRHEKCIQNIGRGDPREREHLEDLGIDGLLKWILKIWVREAWTVLIWLRIGAGSGRL